MMKSVNFTTRTRNVPKSFTTPCASANQDFTKSPIRSQRDVCSVFRVSESVNHWLSQNTKMVSVLLKIYSSFPHQPQIWVWMHMIYQHCWALLQAFSSLAVSSAWYFTCSVKRDIHPHEASSMPITARLRCMRAIQVSFIFHSRYKPIYADLNIAVCQSSISLFSHHVSLLRNTTDNTIESTIIEIESTFKWLAELD